MGGTEGQLAQVSPCLVPTFMVNTQHQVKHRPAGKPSYGNRHCRSKYFNYGSQTGRGLVLLRQEIASYGVTVRATLREHFLGETGHERGPAGTVRGLCRGPRRGDWAGGWARAIA